MTEPKVVCEFWTEDAGVYFRLTNEGRMVFHDTTEGEWPGTPIFSARIADFRLHRLAGAVSATLQARVEELEAENSYARGCITEHANFRTAAEARVQELVAADLRWAAIWAEDQAENARLRKALETMPCKCEPELPDVGEYECIRCVALKEKP